MIAAFAILTIVAIVLFVFALCAAASDADDRLDEMAALRRISASADSQRDDLNWADGYGRAA